MPGPSLGDLDPAQDFPMILISKEQALEKVFLHQILERLVASNIAGTQTYMHSRWALQKFNILGSLSFACMDEQNASLAV